MSSVRERAFVAYIRGAYRYAAYRREPLAQLIVRRPQRDPYPLYDTIRSRGQVVRSTLAPVYISASHEFISQAVRAPQLGVTDPPRLSSGLVRPVEDSFLMRNRPDHPRLRRMVTPWFTAKALQQRREALLGLAHQRLDELAGRPRFDVVQDYSVPLAVRIICRLTGLPLEDWRRLAAMGEILPLSTTAGLPNTRRQRRLQSGWEDLNVYLDEAISDRRRAPEGSLLASLSERADDPGQLNRFDFKATLGVLLIAGFETSVGLMGHLTSRFVDHPELRRAALADREVLGRAIEEMLRYEPPVQFTARRVHQDCEIAGQELRAGHEVFLLLAGGCRDPEVFEQADTFQLDRPNSKAHLAFSGGEHYCIGAGLARLETEIAIQALFERRPELRRAGRPQWQPTQNIRALRRIPLRS
ncbi:cytochrome P450 [Kineosporia rhizophila]|uniref:cytochrome P450 n=1 Tax=Kineosporia rhizophila TaxID=84633 RepID=UPI000AB7012D|nr:cytochrome P450 [Kineosporia rhizophila]